MKEKLYEDLQDPSYAAAYVNEALLEGDEVVFKTLKPETRTSFTTYHSLLTACGIDFATRPIKPKTASRAARK
mgnify:FL=1